MGWQSGRNGAAFTFCGATWGRPMVKSAHRLFTRLKVGLLLSPSIAEDTFEKSSGIGLDIASCCSPPFTLPQIQISDH